MSVELDVMAFMKAMGQMPEEDVYENGPDKRLSSFRISLLDEEYDELLEAIHHGDRQLIAKELADLVYVTVGTAVAFGIPFDAVWDAVHGSNMSKLDDEGNPYLRPDGKVMKGPNYQPPEERIKQVVKRP